MDLRSPGCWHGLIFVNKCHLKINRRMKRISQMPVILVTHILTLNLTNTELSEFALLTGDQESSWLRYSFLCLIYPYYHRLVYYASKSTIDETYLLFFYFFVIYFLWVFIDQYSTSEWLEILVLNTGVVLRQRKFPMINYEATQWQLLIAAALGRYMLVVWPGLHQ